MLQKTKIAVIVVLMYDNGYSIWICYNSYSSHDAARFCISENRAERVGFMRA